MVMRMCGTTAGGEPPRRWRGGDRVLVCDLRARLVQWVRNAAHSPDARVEVCRILCMYVWKTHDSYLAPRDAVTRPPSDAGDGRSGDSAEASKEREAASAPGQSVLHQRADAAKRGFHRGRAGKSPHRDSFSAPAVPSMWRR